MNNASEMTATQIILKPGLIETAQRRAGIRSEAAFARLLNVTVAEMDRLRRGGEVTVRAAVGIAAAFGLPLREVVVAAHREAVAA